MDNSAEIDGNMKKIQNPKSKIQNPKINYLLDNWIIKLLGYFRRQAGFTLIELIVVMAILAILAGALWGNFFSSITKGRDSRRKQDLESVTKALELYFNDNKAYPTALPAAATPFLHPSDQNVVYMQRLPQDPSYPGADYCYMSDGTYYKYYAKLENLSDPKIFTTPVACPLGGVPGYNYGISSPNTTP